MGVAKTMKNGILIDETKWDLVEKDGKPMMFFKQYKAKRDQFRAFNPDHAIYHNAGKKGYYEAFVDHDTLMQLSPQEAFVKKEVDAFKMKKYSEAGDILAAQKETKKRMEGKTDYLRDLIIYGSLVLIAMFIFLSAYYTFSSLANLKTIQIHCDNCEYGATVTTTIPVTVNPSTGSPAGMIVLPFNIVGTKGG